MTTGAKIAAALVKAQKGFSPALKTSSNPYFKSKYADLSSCVEAVMDSLNDNGIALIQMCHESESGVIVETTFIHESGETLSCGKLHVPAPKNDPQGYGSALTYTRRYSLMAACGIAPEDDDGNAASKAKNQPQELINQKRVSACKDMLQEELTADKDEPDYQRMQAGMERLTQPEQIAVLDAFGKEKCPGTNRLYTTIIADCLKRKPADEQPIEEQVA